MASSSSSASSSHIWRYDVFFSFHGPDARGGFLSHLRRQFTEKGITMFNDEEIERGHTIGPALLQAIRGSRIAILILSEKYASSSWCLDELLEIMECREAIGQIVLTIFYGVEPSDVRKQTGEFGIAFNKTCDGKKDEKKRRWSQAFYGIFGKTDEKRTRWSRALNDAAIIAGYDFKNCYNEAKMIEKIANEVSDKLHATPSMFVQEKEAQTSEVQERQLPQTIVGQEIMLDKAWKHLKEDGVGLMGLYGMGGVGKTTLLKQINNKFSDERCGFDFVIWVVVSRELHLEQIQDEITRQVGLAHQVGLDKSRKDDYIYNFLRKKKFVLLLDDIWEMLDLADVGIPFPTNENRCKVVFTTRSEAVCTQMGVEDPIEVRCLSQKEAFDLFQTKVGKKKLGSDLEILDLARTIAKKCCGLPLALNVIGMTMSGKTTIQEWRHAIDVLTSYAAGFSGMEDKILPILKYSYDNIKEEHVQSCLLYCALFPEDDIIPKEKLIEYWIGEGIIDGSGGIERAENKGYEIICTLVRASLLMEEEVTTYSDGYTVRMCMHDVVREMALWIASKLGTEKEAFIVHAGVGLHKMPKVRNWNVVRRMSLMKNKIDHLVGEPECLELTTLLLQNNELPFISSEFFKSMPKLAVLDVSKNSKLIELPRISELVSLQYLNLSRTGILHLPTGLQELRELIHLDLSGTPYLRSIAGISSLHSLKVLKLIDCRLTWDHDTMEELKTLEHLEVFTLRIDLKFSALEIFLSSHRLTSCTRELSIWNIAMESSGLVLPVTMDKLCRLDIWNSSISEIKMVSPLQNLKNLCTVFIYGCEGLKELTLLMFAVNLKTLIVRESEQLEDIINKEKASECKESKIVPFPKLEFLSLYNLPELKNIYWSPLPLPCLKKIRVSECPSLKKLPLNSESGTHGENGLIIYYWEREWIKAVEWEDKATETRFLSSCKKVTVSPTPLSYTGIRRLSMGLQELRELIHLDLSATYSLESIAGISSLHSLKVLKLRPCWFPWDDITMEELKTLEHLQFLTLAIDHLSALEIFLSSDRLTSCTRELSLLKIKMKSSGLVIPVTMDKLRHLGIAGSSISEIKMVSPLHNLKNLCSVLISGCEGLKELTLLMFAVNLKDLGVYKAEQLEDIINKEKASESKESKIVPFPKLEFLSLNNLPELKNIYWSPLPLPCLKKISVIKCPNLKKLPLNSESGTHGLITIYGEKEWIEGLEWEDKATETRFLSSCEQFR